MHSTKFTTLTFAAWVASTIAAPVPIPLPQFGFRPLASPVPAAGASPTNIPPPTQEPWDRPTPKVIDNPYITSSPDSGFEAHGPLGTHHKGPDGTYASSNMGTYENLKGGATTYSSGLGSITIGTNGVKFEGPKPKKLQG